MGRYKPLAQFNLYGRFLGEDDMALLWFEITQTKNILILNDYDDF